MNTKGPRGKTTWPKRVWAVSNYGNLIGVGRTRARCQELIKENTGCDWEEVHQHYEIWRCEVRPVQR